VEMHPNPCEAWCDADQALTPLELASLMDSLAAVASAIGRTLDRGEAVRTGKRVAASIDRANAVSQPFAPPTGRSP